MADLTTDSCAIVIFGASGDLTRRKLVPALFSLYHRGLIPQSIRVLGVGRTELSDDAFRNSVSAGVDAAASSADDTSKDAFLKKLYYQQIDTADTEDYARLDDRLRTLDAAIGTRRNFLFYLSTPPNLFGPIARGLGRFGLQNEGGIEGWKRLVVEKPFGYDLATARKLGSELYEIFSEHQIFRIDHYLGKETVQNMLVLRFGNGIFEPLWNRNYIDRVEVTAAESIGVEDRGGYYERAGALRDMFQNHLLQVVGMIAMEPPAIFSAESVRNETMKVFESMKPLSTKELGRSVIRGQYVASTIAGKTIPGYRDENGVDAASKTETYAAVKFFIDNWRWADVPFLVRTGKRLPTRVTEAVIHFKQAPHRLFGANTETCYGCNQLIMRIQPDEGILIKFNMKLPGGGFDIRTVNMDFHYSELSDVYTPEAYERLLLDSMIGDATLYARYDAVEACWKFVDPILEEWKRNPNFALHGYPAGTWGPKAARSLFDAPDVDWRYPCKNLASDGEYCEL